MSGDTSQDVTAAEERRVDKPWGYELRWAITDRYLGKIIHVNKGQQLSLQYHVQKDESIYIASGLIDLVLEDERGEVRTHRMPPGTVARVRPGRRHRFIAVEDSDIFEVSSPEIDDVVRLEDSYGREGTNTR
ncbi:MAG: cupin domain-containing protein [Candidatus Dormibacteraeota bacterium]|uniref:Cupin domain-containing protein n=1 Tax=Candidatus Amunia macphersoniae TaxID=3127014 RepID=A0A934KQZ2_9BACT|nr:cupin domain-containing protein [Candidatus Dormibacteraeota bacterium]